MCIRDSETRHGRHSVCLAGMSQRLQRRVRKDLVVQDRVEQGAHQLAVIGGAHRFSQFEQGKLVQGHRVMPTFVSDFGWFSQRLTGWPLTLVTVSATNVRNPIYATRRDSIRDYRRAGKD